MVSVIRAGRLVDGTGAAPTDATAIVVEDGLIREVGAEGGEFSLDGSAERIDYSDCTVLPGLIDCHVHLVFSALPTALQDILTEDNRQLLLRAVHNAQLALRTGVTTVRDCGGRAGVTFTLRDAIEAGVVPGPRIFAAGPAITTTGGHCYFLEGEADGADELRRMARRLAKEGADFFKIMSTGGRMTPGTNVTAAQFSQEELSALVVEARRLNRTVAAHGHGTAGIRNAVAAGVTTIEHCTWVSEEDSAQLAYEPEVAAQMARQGTFLDATLTPGVAIENLPESELTPSRAEVRRMRPAVYEAQRAMLAVGVEPIAGTDAGVAGVPLDSMPIEVMALHQRLGLSPLDPGWTARRPAGRRGRPDGRPRRPPAGPRGLPRRRARSRPRPAGAVLAAAAAMAALRRFLDRALFDPRAVQRPERLLGFAVLALVALGAWLIFWPFIPPLIARIVVALLDLLGAIFGAIWSALSALSSWWSNR